MIKAIIKGVFALIMALFSLIISPFVNAILALFPDISNAINSIIYFTNLSLTYVPGVCRLLLIDRTMLVFLFDYFFILYSVYLVARGIIFALNTYRKLKP